MTETVVHVTTLEEWKSVLDVWFNQGYDWARCNTRDDYREEFYYSGSRQLGLNVKGIAEISYWSLNDYTGDNLIEYSDFMSQQKDGNKMATYYVTQEQLDIINRLKDESYPSMALAMNTFAYGSDYEEEFNPNALFTDKFIDDGAEALTRFLAGDNRIEFKVKKQFYRLWRFNNAYNRVYMKFNLGTPDWTMDEDFAFKAPLEEIKKWKTPAWDIEEVKE